MAVKVYVATSLDGFIAGPNGELDWLMEIPNPEQSDHGFADFMAGIDAIVVGRNTFQSLLTFDAWSYHMPVFVLSNTLDEVPETLRGKAEIVSGDPESVVDQLAKRGRTNLYIDGGRVIQSFLERDLIDEMIITRVPVLLGDGIPLFGRTKQRLEFKTWRTEELGQGLVKSCYARARPPGASSPPSHRDGG